MATEIERLIVTLEASTKQYERALAKAQNTTVSAMRKIERTQQESAARQTAIFAKMGKQINSGLTSALRGMGRGLVVGILGSLGVDAIGKAIKSVAELGDTAANLGIKTEDLQTFNRLAVESGESAEEMARALTRIADQSQDADSALNKLFSANKVQASGDVTKDMLQLMDILQRLPTAAQRTAAIVDIFGQKLGPRLAEALAQGPGKFLETFREMERAGEHFADETVKRAQELESEWNRMTDKITIAFTDAMIKSMDGWQNFEETAVPAARATAEAIAAIVKEIKTLIGWLKTAEDFFDELFGAEGPADLGRKLHERLFGGGANVGAGSQPSVRAAGAVEYFARGPMEFGTQVARGIVAGMQGESGAQLNPAAEGDLNEPGGMSFGIAQWREERLTELRKFAASWNKPVDDFATQLAFVSKELSTNKKHVAAMLANAKTAEEALAIWVRYFEVPADIPGAIEERKKFLRGGPDAPAGKGPATVLAAPGKEKEDLGDYRKTEQIIADLTKRHHEQERDAYEKTNEIIGDLSEQRQAQLLVDAQQFEQYNDMMASAVSGFAQDLMNGVEAGEAFSNMLKQLASQLVDMAIQNLFSAGGQPGGLFGSLFGGAMPKAATGFAHGGSFKVGGSGATDSKLVAFRATPGEMVTVSPRRLARQDNGGANISTGGTVVHVNGNADDRVVALMDRRIQENNYRQRQELQREWGGMSVKYGQLRSP